MNKKFSTPKFYIFNRILFDTLKSKVWIIFTSICFVVVFFVILMPVVINRSSELGKLLLLFAPMMLMIGYIAFFNIFHLWKYFANEMNNGIMHLEIRNGLSRTTLFCERLLVNKIFTFTTTSLFILLFFIIHISSGQEFDKVVALKYSPGLFFVLIFDFVITAFILLVFTLKSTVLMGIIGTIILIFFTITPFAVSFLESSTSIKIDNKNGESNINVRNYQMALAKEVQKFNEKYKDESIFKIIRDDLKEFNKVELLVYDEKNNVISLETLDSDIYVFNSWVSDIENFDFLLGERYYKGNFNDKYIYDLLSSGLFNEIENLPIYTYNTDDVDGGEILFPVTGINTFRVKLSNADIVKDTKTWKFMNNLKEKINYNNLTQWESVYSDESIYNSNFVKRDHDYDTTAINKFSGSFGYFDVFNKIKNTNNKQFKELLNLIDSIIKANFLKTKTATREGGLFNTVKREVNSATNYFVNDMFFKEWNINDWGHIAQQLKISPGQRLIQKTIFDLIDITQNFTSEHYKTTIISNGSFKQIDITAEEVKQHLAKQNVIPFLLMWKQMSFINGNPLYDLALDESIFMLDGYSIPTYIYKINGFRNDTWPKSEQKRPLSKFNYEKNYDSIEYLGSTANIPLSYFIVILIMMMIIGLGFLIFYKRIIK